MKRAVVPIAYENDGCGTLTLKNAQELEDMLSDGRAWDMLSEGRSVDEVRIATGFSKAVLEAMLRDIERDRIRRNGS